jgi:hypothetical protein
MSQKNEKIPLKFVYKLTQMKNLIYNHLSSIIGILLGALGGYLYYYFVGCSSGSCAITSNPINSILYGGVMGYLLFSTFEKNK